MFADQIGWSMRMANWEFLVGIAVGSALVGLAVSEWTGHPVVGALIGCFGAIAGTLFCVSLSPVETLSLLMIAWGTTIIAIVFIRRYQDRQHKRGLALWRGQQANKRKGEDQ